MNRKSYRFEYRIMVSKLDNFLTNTSSLYCSQKNEYCNKMLNEIEAISNFEEMTPSIMNQTRLPLFWYEKSFAISCVRKMQSLKSSKIPLQISQMVMGSVTWLHFCIRRLVTPQV